MLDFARGCVGEWLGPKGAAAGEGAPFAGDGMLLDVRLDHVDVENFKACNVWGGVEEERLTVTSVLRTAVLAKFKASRSGIVFFSMVDQIVEQGIIAAKRTLPVAPQHASRASSITMLRSLALASSAKYRAADAPVIPEPTMTISAIGGSSDVVRCPRRKSDGSLCQNEAVDFSEGRLAIFLVKL